MTSISETCQKALDELAQVRAKAGAIHLTNAKALVRQARDQAVAEQPPIDSEPTPSSTLFHETFDISPAPTNYGDTPIWTNDGERVPVSGGIARVDTEKVRLWTHQKFPSDVEISARIYPLGWRTGDSRFASSWSGFKFYVLRQVDHTHSAFYTVEPFIYNGRALMQKKCLGQVPGGNYVADEFGGGTYFDLGHVDGVKPAFNMWHTIAARSTVLSDGSIKLTMLIDGKEILSAIDTAGSPAGCSPLGGSCCVGFRSDCFRYDIDDFVVSN